jgi:hypothetical protein
MKAALSGAAQGLEAKHLRDIFERLLPEVVQCLYERYLPARHEPLREFVNWSESELAKIMQHSDGPPGRHDVDAQAFIVGFFDHVNRLSGEEFIDAATVASLVAGTAPPTEPLVRAARNGDPGEVARQLKKVYASPLRRLLLRIKAMLPALAKRLDVRGRALRAAIEGGHCDVVSMIVQRDPSVCAQRYGDGGNAFALAVSRGDASVLRAMLAAGGQPVDKGDDLWIVLEQANARQLAPEAFEQRLDQIYERLTGVGRALALDKLSYERLKAAAGCFTEMLRVGARRQAGPDLNASIEWIDRRMDFFLGRKLPSPGKYDRKRADELMALVVDVEGSARALADRFGVTGRGAGPT